MTTPTLTQAQRAALDWLPADGSRISVPPEDITGGLIGLFQLGLVQFARYPDRDIKGNLFGMSLTPEGERVLGELKMPNFAWGFFLLACFLLGSVVVANHIYDMDGPGRCTAQPPQPLNIQRSTSPRWVYFSEDADAEG